MYVKAVPVMPALLVLGFFAVQVFYIERAEPAEPLAGEDATDDNALQLEGAAFVNNGSPLGELQIAHSPDDFVGFVLVEKSSVVGSAAPGVSALDPRSGPLTYQIEEGDSISTIAANFGISVNTIIWANDISNSSYIKPGQEIVILPVSGVLHEIKSGESLNSIAALYDVPLEKIATFNKTATVAEGDTVVVPNAKPVSTSKETYVTQSSLPNTSGYFRAPVLRGWNWGELHNGDAVDFSSACGSPIYAAADGTVTNVSLPSTWSSGYGGFVTIAHANGTKTFYAHNAENLVSVGDTVAQGEHIANVGRTGRVYGSTGCHVHFGVIGAQNPFVR